MVRVVAKVLVGLVVAAVCGGCATTRNAGESRPANWQWPGRQSSPSDTIPAAEPVPLTTPAHEPGATAVSPPPTASRSGLVALRDWVAGEGLAAPAQSPSNAGAFNVGSPNGRLWLEANNNVVRWDGMEVHLGFPPVLVRNQLYLKIEDIRSTIQPLLCGAPPVFARGQTVVLDPGHGGADSGARCVAGGYEDEYTLDWALRLRDLLMADGWRVVLTRSTDTEVTLSNRVALADAENADLFLSLHFNSSVPDKAGLETYCLTPAGVPSTLTRGYSDELNETLPNNSFDASNIFVAMKLHSALLKVNGRLDRGIRRARFVAVLRTQNRPAVLIEGGYLSNPVEARRIASAAHRQELARALAEALRPLLIPADQNSTILSGQ